MTDRLSPRSEAPLCLPPRMQFQKLVLNRRQALFGASAVALLIGISPRDASAAAMLNTAEPTDMTGHVPAYNAPIGFSRQKTATTIDDPYDLIFA